MTFSNHAETLGECPVELVVLEIFVEIWIHRPKDHIDVDTHRPALFESLPEKFASPATQTVSNDRGSYFSTERETDA